MNYTVVIGAVVACMLSAVGQSEPAGAMRGTNIPAQMSSTADVRTNDAGDVAVKDWAKEAAEQEKLIAAEPDKADHWYDLGCARAQLGDTAKAIAALTNAVERGYSGMQKMKNDGDLVSLRNVPAFKALLMVKNTAAQQNSARAGLEKLKKKHGDALTYEIDDEHKMIFAMGLDPRSYKEAQQLMIGHARAMQRDLFENPIERYLSVVIPKKWANPKVTGHFYPPAYVDAANIGSDLRHEFTHALHYADQEGRWQQHPVWLMEGLAVLYQYSRVIDGLAVPQITYRVYELQQEVSANKMFPFPVMMKLQRRAFTSHHYGQAGFMLMYLYQKGLLKKFYTAYTAGYEKDNTGIVAYEAATGKSIEAAQKDWVEWLLTLPPPLPLPGKDRPSMGFTLKQQADGVQIDQLFHDGGAETAKLQSGDVIVKADGLRIIDEEDLISVIFKRKIGDAVPVEYRRDTQYQAATITITRVPDPVMVLRPEEKDGKAAKDAKIEKDKKDKKTP